MGRASLYTLHTGVRHFKDSVGPQIQDAIPPKHTYSLSVSGTAM